MNHKLKILVIGATGAIGTMLVEKLSKSHGEIYCQSRAQQKHHKKLKWIKHDLKNNSWEDLKLPDFDVVYYLASDTSVQNGILSPSDNLSDNVLSFIKTLDYLRGQKIKPFIVYAGTITQVGIVDGVLINEDLKDEPRTFYDLGKLTAEKYLLQYIEEGWLEGCSIRLPNVFGAASIQQSKNRGIIDKLFRDALVGKNLEIYGEGKWVRDYLYIDDVTAALEITFLKKKELNGKYFCIGTGEATSLLNAFQKIVNIVGESTGNYVDIIKINIPKNSSNIDFRNSVVDSRKFINATNWSAKYTLEKGLRKCLLTIKRLKKD